MSSLQESDACCSDVQNDSHTPPLFRVHPQLVGDGVSWSFIRACPQQNLLMYCCNATELGGMFSIDRPFLVNRYFLAASTPKQSLLLSYIKTTTRSTFPADSLMLNSSGLSLNTLKSSVTASKVDYVSHAVFFPRFENDETWSQPLNAWKNSSASDLDGPICRAISCTGMYLKVFQTPNATHRHVMLRLCTADTAITTIVITVLPTQTRDKVQSLGLCV